MDEHIPVLLNEVINGLNIKSSGTYVDLTVGRGGHSSEILSRLDKGHLICVDLEKEQAFCSRPARRMLKTYQQNFSDAREVPEREVSL